MSNFFKKHHEFALGFLAVIFLFVVAGYFVWGISGLLRTFGEAADVQGVSGRGVRFDLEGGRSFQIKANDSVSPSPSANVPTSNVTGTLR